MLFTYMKYIEYHVIHLYEIYRISSYSLLYEGLSKQYDLKN